MAGEFAEIIPGMILVALEEKIQRQQITPNAHLTDYFDFFAGTSTGGFYCHFVVPDDEEPTKQKYTANKHWIFILTMV